MNHSRQFRRGTFCISLSIATPTSPDYLSLTTLCSYYLLKLYRYFLPLILVFHALYTVHAQNVFCNKVIYLYLDIR